MTDPLEYRIDTMRFALDTAREALSQTATSAMRLRALVTVTNALNDQPPPKKPRTLPCPVCGKLFNSPDSRALHRAMKRGCHEPAGH